MKQLYLLVCLLFSTILFAQDITPEIDTKLQLLDKNYITTDILYDRVFPLANLVEFNQGSNDTSHVNHFYQTYGELQRADYNNRWVPIQTFKANMETETLIPIGIINVDFEYLDEDAISDNLLEIQGQDSLLLDVPNRPRSPYLKTKAIVISTLETDTKSKTVNFILDNSFNIQASNITIQSLQADFDNGQGYQSLSLSGQKSVAFNRTGLHHLKFKVTFSNGSIKYTYAKLKVNSSPPNTKISENITKSRTTEEFCYSDTITASRGFQGYDESIAYKGVGAFTVYKGGDFYDKPVIVLDGFDPFEGDEDLGVSVSDIYLKFLRYGTNSNSNLGLDLRGQGFDIIPLNFIKGEQNDGSITNGGTDYIERNAMVLVELIERINNSSCWTSNVQPIKVIGFSMGGLIGRYALRYMELNNISHNTSLFISIDSPHNGAVVPTGLQEVADFIDDIANIDIADKPLTSPGAKQMLVHHYLSNSKTPAGAPNFHDRFYNTLNSMGFPQQTRNIAVSNGIASGTGTNSPNQNYFNGEIETGASFPIIGIGADAKMKFSPERGETNKVFDFRAKIRFLVFDITVYRRFKEVTSNTVLGSYENSPGGFYTVEDKINQFLGADGVFNTNETLLTGLIFQARAEISTPRFSYIPVKSSLAYSGGNLDLYDDFSTRNLVCSGETPFDSYFTAKNDNERHITLTSNGANYIMDEINGIQREPNVEPSSENLNGPELICGQSTYTFDACAGSISSWSVSSNLIIENNTPYSVTVKPKYSTSKGAGYIAASSVTGAVSTKQVYVGKPDANLPQAPTICTSQFMTAPYTLPASEGAETYRLVSSSPYLQIDGQSEFTYTNAPTSVYFSATQAGFYLVELFTTNSCGTSRGAMYVTAENCSGGFETYTVYPNPASEEVFIEDVSKKENNASPQGATHPQQTRQGKLYDFSGNLVKTVPLQAQSAITRMEVSNLKTGLYFLKIQVRDEVEVYKIIVAH